jgi:hypothetical protein
MSPPAVLTVEELDRATVELLPPREALALVNITNITAINLAIAVNAASINSTALALAAQNIAAVQH